ncbi:MAG: response regulator [Selenomonadaceae bacterium]|nr:response regulator [Selenomonadaceae bacterium]
MPYRVVLVEGDPLMMDKLTDIIQNSPEFELVATYSRYDQALGQSAIHNPNLFLLDLENPILLENLHNFAKNFPKAKILGTISKWSEDFAYKASVAGIDGCIIKPFTPAEIFSAIELYAERGKKAPPRIISFFSPKGRAGRTTLAALMALHIARKSDESVALIDADLQFGDLPIFFDIQPEHSVVDATHDVSLLTPITFKPYFHKLSDRLYLLSSPDRPELAELVAVQDLINVIAMAGDIFRYVFVDLPTAFNPISVGVSEFSDACFVVSMINTNLEIIHMKRCLDMFEMDKHHGRKIYPVFTRVNPCNEEQREKMSLELGYDITAIFPNEYSLVSTANSGQILRHVFPKNNLMIQNVEKIAEQIMSNKM